MRDAFKIVVKVAASFLSSSGYFGSLRSMKSFSWRRIMSRLTSSFGSSSNSLTLVSIACAAFRSAPFAPVLGSIADLVLSVDHCGKMLQVDLEARTQAVDLAGNVDVSSSCEHAFQSIEIIDDFLRDLLMASDPPVLQAQLEVLLLPARFEHADGKLRRELGRLARLAGNRAIALLRRHTRKVRFRRPR